VKFLFGASLTPFEWFLAAMVCVAVAVAFRAPAMASRQFTWVESRLKWLGARPLGACLAAGMLPLILRAILLPVYGVPEPGVHDEYSVLLQADTFASGRWTNPTPPLPENFESLYILLRPTYASQYQAANGLFLAAAKVLTGIPWLGIYFAMGIAFGLLVWMLRAWMPPVWALAGATIAAFQFGVLSYWMNGYFGAAVAMIGGTLALGALGRIRGGQPLLHGALLGLGLAILMHCRPLEALILFLAAMCAIVAWMRTSRAIAVSLVPIGAILLMSSGLMAVYNAKVTGNPTELPYRLNQKLYGTPQGFYWQAPLLIDKFPNQQLRDEYLAQLRLHSRRDSLKTLLAGTLGRLRIFWSLFIGPALTIPLLLLPRIWRGPDMRLMLFLCAAFAFDYLTFFAFLPHYAAPIAGIVTLIVIQCVRQLRTSPAGLFLSRALPLICVLGVAVPMAGRYVGYTIPTEFASGTVRPRLQDRLLAEGGRHLVIVRYEPTHQVDTEWVYNDADIPNSPVVWARELDAESIPRLMAAFPGRKVWIGLADANPPALVPYSTR
jgi:hypothetical protein